MAKVGIFFFVNDYLVSDAVALEQGDRNRLDPLRNLWDFPVSYSTEPYGETIQHP